MIDPLPAAQPGQDLVLLALPVRRNDDANRLADDLVRRISEELLGRGVPRRDDPVQVFRDDGVIGRLDDAAEQRALVGWLWGTIRAHRTRCRTNSAGSSRTQFTVRCPSA